MARSQAARHTGRQRVPEWRECIVPPHLEASRATERQLQPPLSNPARHSSSSRGSRGARLQGRRSSLAPGSKALHMSAESRPGCQHKAEAQTQPAVANSTTVVCICNLVASSAQSQWRPCQLPAQNHLPWPPPRPPDLSANQGPSLPAPHRPLSPPAPLAAAP